MFHQLPHSCLSVCWTFCQRSLYIDHHGPCRRRRRRRRRRRDSLFSAIDSCRHWHSCGTRERERERERGLAIPVARASFRKNSVIFVLVLALVLVYRVLFAGFLWLIRRLAAAVSSWWLLWLFRGLRQDESFVAGIILPKKEPFSAQIIRHAGWRVLFIGVSECVWRISAITRSSSSFLTQQRHWKRVRMCVGRRFVGRSSW